jgi:hydroxyacylglutathione hydrolase
MRNTGRGWRKVGWASILCADRIIDLMMVNVLDFGSIQLQAIHAPGHLDDHYCFLETFSGTLFSIDIDFTGFGPWYGNPEGDISRFRRKCNDAPQPALQPDLCLPQTADAKSDADEAFDRYLKAFDRQKAAVYDLCRQRNGSGNDGQISPFYRNRMPDGTLQRIFETQMIRKNLDLLIRENRIVEENGQYIALIGCFPSRVELFISVMRFGRMY